MSDPLQLSPQHFIAEGSERSCFRHPADAGLCVKPMQPPMRPGRLWREMHYYRGLQRRGVDFRHLARYQGMRNTNLGRANLFELVVDDDGRISQSLAHYLERQDADFNDWAARQIEQLKQDFYDQWIVCHDFDPTNILVQRLSYDQYRLVVINGIGRNPLLAFSDFIPACARSRLVQAWNRRYHQWFAAFPDLLRRLKPYPSS